MSNSRQRKKEWTRAKKNKRLTKLTDRKLNGKMRRKLVWVLGAVMLALVGLSIRITYINSTQGEKYKKQVLTQSQQQYESRTIPFKRGDILDANGTVLATSEKVYNVILDCKVVNSDKKYIEPTVNALVTVLGMDEEVVREKLEGEDTKASQYQIIMKSVPITDKKDFEEYCEVSEEKKLSEDEIKERQNVKGVWFEEDYLRKYPLNAAGSSVIGFTYSGNAADWGIEGYYSSVLNGINGRQYGYFNSDADVEQTIIEPKNGKSVISTIDMNIQEVVEKHIAQFMDSLANGPNGDRGAEHVGVIVADPTNGDILAMADSNTYDLNNPRDLTAYSTEEEIAAMTDEDMLDKLNSIWKNYCISDAYEPGSTIKPMTIAGALESGAITEENEFYCDGYQVVSGEKIKCSVYPYTHDQQTLTDVMKNSCNDALMQIADKMGVDDFVRYQEIFNFGSKTGIDLPGEAAGLTYNVNSMGSVQLATCSFGQGNTVTMMQEMAALCSVINGGYYYQPHVVKRIVDSDGSVGKNIEPTILKQTVSEETSANIRDYMGAVVGQGGTGKTAKVEGYSMGGKTGTAQKIPRGSGKYLISFIGFAPLQDPQVAVYVVIDEPNVEVQSVSTYAQYVYKKIMEDILPYMGIFPDEGVESETGNDTTLNDILEANDEDFVAQEADTSVPEPPEDTEEITGGDTGQDEGVTNEEAEIENEEE